MFSTLAAGCAVVVVSSSVSARVDVDRRAARSAPVVQREGSGVTDPLAKALDALRARSEAPVYVRARAGRLSAAEFRIPLSTASGDPVDDALAFLEANAEALRVPAPRQTLYLDRLEQGEDGASSVFFDQHFDGVTVHGAQIVVFLEGKTATGVDGAWLDETPPSATPTIDERRAEEVALADARQRKDGGSHRIAGSPRLMHYDASLLGDPGSPKGPPVAKGDRLVWRVSVQSGGGGMKYAVDAHTGAVVTATSASPSALDYEVASAGNGNEVWPCWIKRPPGNVFSPDATPWFRETGQVAGSAPDAEGVAANGGLRGFYNVLAGFGRDAWDGRGGHMYAGIDLSVIDFGAAGRLTNNARYSYFCNNLAFTNNMATRDVVAHEAGHGVVRYTANFDYNNLPNGSAPQSASLHEHYGDVYGALVDTGNWTIGEGSAIGTIRDMENPPAVASRPDRMSQITMSAAPHPNSTIMSKAFFLVAQGQSFNNVNVVGIGRGAAGRLWHEALTTRLTTNANFQSAADQMVALARSFAATGRFGFTDADACSVARAFSAVELDGDVDCDSVRDSADASNDTDLDGLADVSDNCPFATNPGQLDTDRDGQGDACDADSDNDGHPNGGDNCPLVGNPRQEDFNRDGRGDACADSDFDRVLDDADNCRLVRNTDQRDADGDAFGDACDADVDGDGICHALDRFRFTGPVGGPPVCPSSEDNCPLAPNPVQTDTDGDGYGDACDQCVVAANTGRDTDRDGVDDACDVDIDNDGVVNGSDNCPEVANADQLDVDGDGIGTACDFDEPYWLRPGQFRFEGAWQVKPNWIYRVPVGCPSPDHVGPRFGDGSEAIELGFNSSAPIDIAIVNRAGERMTSVAPGMSGKLLMPTSRDLCPLVGVKEGPLGVRAAEQFMIEIVPAARTEEFSLSIEGGLAPFVRPTGEAVPEK